MVHVIAYIKALAILFPILCLLVTGCGSSAAPAATSTPAPTSITTPQATVAQSTTVPVVGDQTQVLVDDAKSGNTKGYSNEYIFTNPRGPWTLHWQFACPPKGGVSAVHFVIFSSTVHKAPLLDPGIYETSGSGVLHEKDAPGKRIALAVLAYGTCHYHVRVIG